MTDHQNSVGETPGSVRIYVSGFRPQDFPETLHDIFQHVTTPEEQMVEKFCKTLDYQDPLLVGPTTEWNFDNGNPLLNAWQAIEEGRPVELVRCVESADAGKTPEGLEGLSVRRVPGHGWIGLDPAEVVRRGQPGPTVERPAQGQERIQPYTLDGFQAFAVLERRNGVLERKGVFPTREAAQKAVRPERERFRDDGRGR